MGKIRKKIKISRVITRIILSLAIIGAGIFAMNYFKSLKKSPHRGRVKERILQVEVKKAVPQSIETRLKGFGVAQPVTMVKLSGEVAGRIIYTHPRFEKGRTILKDEILFKIDPADYLAELKSLKAGLEQKQSLLAGIEQQFKSDRVRVKTIQRTMDLSRAEYERVRVLLEENSIGNRSELDQSEQFLNNAVDSYDQMKRSLSLYPVQIQEAVAGIDSASANVDRAAANLARCTVTAPFTCRITSIAMEEGEYATKGREVVTLADDSFLEIQVSLDAREASQWLSFVDQGPGKLSGWFPPPRPVPCEIAWIEAKNANWSGVVERLVEFDQASRTMTLAVKFDPSQSTCKDCSPLVAGMFCSVSIPGKTIEGLFQLKRWLVTTDNTVYISREDRLKTLSVNKVYASGDDVFLSGEINPGDLLITTRLVDPLENSALKIMNRE
ncbi:MAG: HlyD family efflux transporter periplasmic adaptor subunit [Desulfobacteraceae bacterium]|nr:HlyD family efflux transporter periplasmic adaptor subunit [Desulfobacteraceae bacterium]